MGPSPLLDFFKRGDATREARLLAAQGKLAPRAHEQLSILVLLLDDPEAEIRQAAEQTLGRIPPASLAAVLARSDTTPELREFFEKRGVIVTSGAPPAGDQPPVPASPSPAQAKAEDPSPDAPLVDDKDAEDEPHEADTTESATQKIARMTFPQRLKAAVKGSREMRAILVRDPNKMISAAVLSSPKLTEQEVESIARMANVSEDVLRTIATNRAWTKNYSVVVGLTKNPKTPLAMSMNLMNRLSERDLTQLAVDRNVPDPLRVAARKRVQANTSGKG